MAVESRVAQPPVPSASAAAPPPRFAALSHRNFSIFWISLLVTNVGTWMGSVAEGWLITDLEPARKSFYIGLLAFAFAVPMLLLPPFGGVFADRLPRLTGIKLTQLAFLGINSTVAFLALTDQITVHVLIAAAFAGAVVLAFDSPIRHSIVPELVPREFMTSAVSLNAVAFSGAGLVGPAVGGLLIPFVGAGGVFLVNAISTLSVLVALRFLRDLPESARVRNDKRGENPMVALRRAVTYVRDTPVMASLFLVALTAGTFGRSYTTLMPVVSRDVYHVGSTANGILISAAGLGAMSGGLLLSAYSTRITRRGLWIAVSPMAQGLLLATIALHTVYLLGVFTLLAMGALGASTVALITATVQEHVPQELRGRVIGFFLMTFISFPSVGSFLMGLLADQTSIQWAFAVFAAIVVALVALISLRAPSFRHAR